MLRPQILCGMVIFSASKVVAYVVPKKDDGAESGEWEPKEATGKLFLAHYGCLIEDFKVRPLSVIIINATIIHY